MRSELAHLRSVSAALDDHDTKANLARLMLTACPWPLVIGNTVNWQVVNDAFAAGLGYSRAHLEARHWTEFADPTSVEVVEFALQTEAHTELVIPYRTADGAIRRVLWAWSAPDPVAGLSVAVGRFDP